MLLAVKLWFVVHWAERNDNGIWTYCGKKVHEESIYEATIGDITCRHCLKIGIDD